MLTVGLTGGIGSGKSAVAGLLAAQGATVVDADRVAREVLAAGTPGLAEVAAAFGEGLVRADGSLDRPALAAVVFGDDAARARLDEIVHPRIADRTRELMAAAAGADLVVHDVPLLVELGMGPRYHLVVVVHAPAEVRLARLDARGVEPADARARMAAQADDDARRAAADVWLPNGGSLAELGERVVTLSETRLLPYAANLRTGARAERGPVTIVEPDPDWAAQGARLAARLRHVVPTAVRVEHVGSTAVSGLPAKDVIDLQLEVDGWPEVLALTDRLGEAGFPRRTDVSSDPVRPEVDPDPAQWRKHVHLSADPGRPANVHVRVADTVSAQLAVRFRDRLRADPAAAQAYSSLKRQLATKHPDDLDGYSEGKTEFVLRTVSEGGRSVRGRT